MARASKSRVIAALAHYDAVSYAHDLSPDDSDQATVEYDGHIGPALFREVRDLGWQISGLSGHHDHFWVAPQ